jgi:hypothetical protein
VSETERERARKRERERKRASERDREREREREDNRLAPRPLILDVTMMHYRYGRTTLHANGSSRTQFPPMALLSLTEL